MNKKTPAKSTHAKSRDIVKAARTDLKLGAAKVESVLKRGSEKVESAWKEGSSAVESKMKPGSPERMAAGIAAAAGGALIAAATLGVGQTALAGAAGYAAYRGMKKEKKARPLAAGRKH